MPAIKVPTSFNIDVEFEIPEFYKRLLALIIDIVIQYFYLLLARWVYYAIVSSYNDYNRDTIYDLNAIGLLFFSPLLVYHLVLEILMNGQSVGKKIMGIRVVNENGGRPAISQFIIRWMLRDIWFFFLFIIGLYTVYGSSKTEGVFLIVLVLAYFVTEIVLVVSSKKGQRLGDILAKTILISTRAKADIEETVFQEVEDSYIPAFPQIMQLSDKDINSIKSILQTAKKKGDFQLAAVAADKIKNHLNIRDNMSPFDFLEIVLKDYNYLSAK